jgi:hypothetical protein
VWGDVADTRASGELGNGLINPGDPEPPTSNYKGEIGSQAFGPSRDPIIDKCFQLRMERDVAVVVELANRHAQPVRRTAVPNPRAVDTVRR